MQANNLFAGTSYNPGFQFDLIILGPCNFQKKENANQSRFE